MAAVRRYARLALVVFTALFMVMVVVQFLTAGFAQFGATTFELHEDLGFTVTHLLAILVFLAALVGWVGRTDLALAFLIGALTTVQNELPAIDNGWIAGLHPLNALVLFLLAHVLLRRARALVRPAAYGNLPAR